MQLKGRRAEEGSRFFRERKRGGRGVPNRDQRAQHKTGGVLRRDMPILFDKISVLFVEEKQKQRRAADPGWSSEGHKVTA